MLAWLLLACAVLGALDALYFVAVTYRWMAPDARWVPSFCRMDDQSCARIVDTRWARVLGLPNAVYGVAWYALVGFAAGRVLLGDPLPWCPALLTISAGTVVLSVLLFWAIVWRMRTRCPLCFLGHGVNVAILGLLVAICV